MFSSDALIGVLVFTLLVVLVMGPGMWSSSTDPMVVVLWRRLRGRRGGAPARRADDSRTDTR